MPNTSFADWFYFIVSLSLISVQIVKISLLIDLKVFVTIKGTLFGDLVFDNTDGMIQSPRFLSLFTISILSGCTVHQAAKN